MALVAYRKNFTTHAEQIQLLQSRGMTFKCTEAAAAYLSRIGYYRLSAYWHPFRRRSIVENETVIEDVFYNAPLFEDVIDFYIFDKHLRAYISDALERIEITLRAQIVEYLGAIHPRSYRNAANFNHSFKTNLHKYNVDKTTGYKLTMFADWLQRQDKNFERSKEDYKEHFAEKYESPPPIWIAKEAWDWGILSQCYSGMEYNPATKIASFYGNITQKEMKSWIGAFNDTRNICAHHSRLWNKRLVKSLAAPKQGAIPELDHMRDENCRIKLYGVLIAIVFLMKKIHPHTRWHIGVRDFILASEKRVRAINYHSAGFPEDWYNQSIWQES